MGVIIWFMWPLFSDVFEEGGVAAVVERVREAGVGGFFVLEGLQFLQIVVAFIPGEVVQIAAGMIYGPWLGALAVLLGCVVTSALIFLLVHKLGAPFVQDMVPMAFLEKFRAFEASGKLDVVVFVLFLIPGLPKDTFTYLVPLTDMPLGRFLLLANVGRIPGIVISTFAAGSLAEGDYLQAGIIFALAAAIAVLGLLNKDRIIAFFERGRERTRTRQ